MEKSFTEKELKDALIDGSAEPDSSFFNENYADVTTPLGDNPTDGERWHNAVNPHFEVYLDMSVRRMEISIKLGGQRLGCVYQDAIDGDIYPQSEGGDPYSSEIRETLIERGAAFEGDMNDPATIVGFVEDIPPSELVCDLIRDSDKDADDE